ncbi:glycosyltransferase [Gemmobacter lanyuensis]
MALLNGIHPRKRGDGRAVALVFGALTRRKGIFQTLDAWQHLAPADRAGLALRFVGRLGDAERAPFLENLAMKRAALPDAVIELEDRFLTDEDLAAEITGADIILAPYQNHIGSSGVMHWAVAAGKPLIAQKTGLIGYQVDRYQLGATTDCSDPKQIARAIMAASGQANAVLATFASKHTPANFVRTILDEMI